MLASSRTSRQNQSGSGVLLVVDRACPMLNTSPATESAINGVGRAVAGRRARTVAFLFGKRRARLCWLVVGRWEGLGVEPSTTP